MSKKSRPPGKPGRVNIQRRVVLLVVAITTAVLALYGIHQYMDVQSDASAELDALAEATVHRLAANLALPLWQFDEDQIEKALLAEMADHRVYGVSVTCASGILSMAKRRDDAWNVVDGGTEPPAGDLVTATAQVRTDDKVAGEVTLHLSKRSIAARLQREVRKIVATTLLLDLCLMLCLTLVMQRSVIRPLGRISSELAADADHLSATSGQIAGSSRTLAQGVSEQAASAQETSASLEEMAVMSRKTAENMVHVDGLISGEAKPNFDSLEHTMAEMARLTESARRSGEEMAAIIKTIDEIAFQTNLLALNAAVEAARAGESGAGFSVVAQEVRTLAARAAEASRSTGELIRKVGEENGKVAEMNRRMGESLSRNIEIAQRVNQLVSEVAAASREQAEGIKRLSGGMTEIDRINQRNAAISRDSASAAVEMRAHAERLKRISREFIAMIGNRGEKAGTPPGGGSKKKARRRLPAPAENGRGAEVDLRQSETAG